MNRRAVEVEMGGVDATFFGAGRPLGRRRRECGEQMLLRQGLRPRALRAHAFTNGHFPLRLNEVQACVAPDAAILGPARGRSN